MKTFSLLFLAFGCLLPNSAFGQSQDLVESFRDEMLMQEVFRLSNNRIICKELEIVDAQLERIKKTASEFVEKSNTLVSKFRLDEAKIKLESKSKATSPDETSKLANLKAELRKSIAALHKQTTKDLEEILLSHQMKRIKQIAVQKQIKMTMAGHDGLQVIQILARELKLSANELKRLQERIDEARKQRDEEIAKANRKAENKILSILTPTQRKLIKEKIGDLYFD